ncbi:MAG: AtpZ/AtpI family protein [Candidatus Omnitrophica bacterium]|nr:AtpZ/AtpI family protein [Candidatus Omnitrophota bacterium]
MADKEELYKRIKIAGLVSYIPIILATSSLAGFFLGDYLQKKFHLSFYFMVICAAAGVVLGIRESVRILRLVLRIDKKV